MRYSSTTIEHGRVGMGLLEEYFAGISSKFSCEKLKLECDDALVLKRNAVPKKKKRNRPRTPRPDQNRWGETSGSSNEQKLSSPVRIPRSSSMDALENDARSDSSWDDGSCEPSRTKGSPIPMDHSPSRPTRTGSSGYANESFFSPLPAHANQQEEEEFKNHSILRDSPVPSVCDASTSSTGSETPLKLPSRKASFDEEQFLELALSQIEELEV